MTAQAAPRKSRNSNQVVSERRRSARRVVDTRSAARSIRHVTLPFAVHSSALPEHDETIGAFLARIGWATRIELAPEEHRDRIKADPLLRRRAWWSFSLPTICIVNGQPVLQRHWKRRRIKSTDVVEFWSRPWGGSSSGGTSTGKQVMGIVALVAIAAFATVVAGPGGLLGLEGLYATAATGAITIGGGLLVAPLTKPQRNRTNIIVQPDAVHLFADGAGYDEDGRFVLPWPKLFAFPHLPAAMMIRGAAFGLPMLAETLASAVSYDAMKRAAVGTLKDSLAGIRKMTTHPDLCGEVQLFVGGWSESTGPDAFTILTAPDSGLPAWEIIPVPQHIFAPFEVNSPTHHEIWDVIGDRSVNEWDPRVDGLAIMEAQRRHKMTTSFGPMYAIGGFCQLVSVFPDRIHTEILKRWPDKIGEKIAPDLDVPPNNENA